MAPRLHVDKTFISTILCHYGEVEKHGDIVEEDAPDDDKNLGEGKDSITIDGVWEEEVFITHVRRLFKLGQADIVSRGAPGRLSIAYGTLDVVRDQWLKDLAAEEVSKKELEELNARR